MLQNLKKTDVPINEVIKIKKKFSTQTMVNSKIFKKKKEKTRERLIFGLIREELCNEDSTINVLENNSNLTNLLNKPPLQESNDSSLEKKYTRRRKKKDSYSYFNTGRWNVDEHQRFIDALLKYGNDWKNVQKFVGSRSSTQARSHAQKFFVKIGKTEIENLHLDFENNSLKSLNIMANKLDNDQLSRAIKSLNDLAFDKKNSGKKNFKNHSFYSLDQDNKFESNSELKKVENFGNIINQNELDTAQDDKITNCCRSTSAENSYTELNKKNRKLRPSNKTKNLFADVSLFDSESIEDRMEIDKEVVMISEQKTESKNFYFFRPHHSKRKSSDIMYQDPCKNFIHDNSIFITNTNFVNMMRKSFDVEDKDFQIIFNNSFKSIGEEKEKKLIFLQDDYDHMLISQGEADASPTENSEIKENITDIIEQYIDY